MCLTYNKFTLVCGEFVNLLYSVVVGNEVVCESVVILSGDFAVK